MHRLVLIAAFLIFFSGPGVTFCQEFSDGIIAIKNGNYEVACHGWRWIDYQNVKKNVEKKI